MPRGYPGTGKGAVKAKLRTVKKATPVKNKYLAVFDLEAGSNGGSYIKILDDLPDNATVENLCNQFGVDRSDLIFYKVSGVGALKPAPVEIEWE